MISIEKFLAKAQQIGKETNTQIGIAYDYNWNGSISNMSFVLNHCHFDSKKNLRRFIKIKVW